MWRVFIIAATIYATLVLILRGFGKRSLAKLNIFDLVVTVAIGSTLATIILSRDVSYAEGALAFVMLAGLQWLVAWASLKLRWFKKLTRSDPRLLFSDGKFLDRAMRDERVMRQEVYSEIRRKGFGDLDDIAAVVLETDGTFSVISRQNAGARSAMKTVKMNPEDPGEDVEPAR